MSIKNVSPLRYPGGKTRACKALESILNEYFVVSSFECLISPFFGGGSFEFYLQYKYNLNIIANDKFTPLYHFWKTCCEMKDSLTKLLYQKVNKIKKDDFYQMRQQIMYENNNPLEQSFMYFIINRCSFSGATLSGGFSLEASKKRFTHSSVDRIKKLDLSQFKIYNTDFEEFINKNYGKNKLIFLDPPYYLQTPKLYGKNGNMHETFEHERLYNCLSNKKNWILTYNNCEYIRDLYKDFRIIETSWSYSMNKSKKSSEIVILSV